MRALGSSVLAFEIVVSILFIPAALQNENTTVLTALLISMSQILLAIMAMATLSKKYGVFLGYLTQVALIASGFLVTWMFVLGLVFLGLWIMAIRIGRRTDELKAAKKDS
jgi:hypothetical protein